jgi:hypothetical protein
MSTIVTRAGKGSPLTHTEVDNNFTNLNTDKYQSGNNASFGTLSATGATTFSGTTVISGSTTANTFSSSGATITGGSINSTAIGGTTAAAGKFTTLEATGVTTVQAGTVSLPAITTTGDTNTGIFFPAADTIAFAEGGAEAMRIDSSGNLLVGRTSSLFSNIRADFAITDTSTSISGGAGAAISIQNLSTTNNTYSTIYFMNGGGGADSAIYGLHEVGNGTSTGRTGSLVFATANLGGGVSERVRIDSDGDVGIGTSSPSSKLTVQGAIRHEFASNTALYTTLNYDGISVVGAQDAYYLVASGQNQTWYVGATERMRITSGGFLKASNTGTYFSTTDPYHELRTNQDFNVVVFSSTKATGNIYGPYIAFTGQSPNNTTSYFLQCADTVERATIRSNGGLANYSANDVNLSDRREKTNFAPAKSYLDTICSIPVQTFNYIDQNLEEDGGLTLGVVAQDVQAVAPELVMESNWAAKDEPEKMRLSIYQTDLQYALMKCIQELKAELDSVKAELQTLKGN